MSRRIDIELTSERPDGIWTWRAAGARQPKGELDGDLLYAGAKTGDVVKADADFDIDGITVIAVLPPKGARREPERLEVIGTPQKIELVTSTLTRGGKGDRGDRGDRGGRGGRPGDRGARPGGRPGDRGERSGGRERANREQRPRTDADSTPRGPRRPRPEVEAKPRPKRLKAGRVHRNAVLAELPPEQRPVAEQVLKGGLPAVRQAVEKQNESAAAEGRPPIKPEPLLALAEQMLPSLRGAEWRDRAEAALADVAEVDLRDLRSVIVAADGGARDDESRELAAQLRTALVRRVEHEHGAWMAELASTLADGRAVRALRLSSRPPKAGSPLPPDMAAKLAEATAAALTADVAQDRWATVLDALAFSPVRLTVVPQGIPAEPSDELLGEVRRLAAQIPQVATLFGIEPSESGKRPRPRPPRGDRTTSGGKRVPRPPRPPRSPADKAEKPEKAEKAGEPATDEVSVPAHDAPAAATPEPVGAPPEPQPATAGSVVVEATRPEAPSEATPSEPVVTVEAEPTPADATGAEATSSETA